MMTLPSQLTDDALLAEVKRLARCERETIATLVAHLAVVEARDLHRAEGYSSMFTYCTDVLGFSEDATCMRLQAARATRLHPEILADLASGALHLSALRFLVPHLTPTNKQELLAVSSHKSKREIEKLMRSRFPLPDVPAIVRKLPSTVRALAEPASCPSDCTAVASRPEESQAAGAVAEVASRPSGLASPAAEALVLVEPAPRPSVIAPLAAERYKVQFTASAALHDKLRRAQDLLRHRVPSGDVTQVFERALDALIERLEKERFAATDRPRAGRGVATGSRAIPAEVKRAVWERDGGRCGFVANNQHRCRETGFLEFHHIVAFARGGEATVANIALRCRAHNQYEAKLEFGPFDPHLVRESCAPWGDARSEAQSAEDATAQRAEDATTQHAAAAKAQPVGGARTQHASDFVNSFTNPARDGCRRGKSWEGSVRPQSGIPTSRRTTIE